MEDLINNREYDDADFLDALVHYGELDHETLMEITDGRPIELDGKEVDSIYWSTLDDDDYLVYSYKQDGSEYERELSLGSLPDDIVDKIYDFLVDNEDPNVDYFNSLS